MASDTFEYLLRLADDRLILGHRLSEWCGHAPILEEDIALANIALDLVGQANLLLTLAGELEGKGRDADTLAFLRDGLDYRNMLMVELPNGDFAFTIARQFFFSLHSQFLSGRLAGMSRNKDLAGIAEKICKESQYHVRHSGQWMLKLGDGTEESHARLQAAVDALWPYTGELFLRDDLDQRLEGKEFNVVAPTLTLEQQWRIQVDGVFERAAIRLPDVKYMQRGGRTGRHTEHLGHMLAEMQTLQRQHPGATW